MNPQAKREAARRAHEAGELAQAEALYRELLAAVGPPDPQVAANLGALLRAQGRLVEAEAHYKWALEHCAPDPMLLVNACNLLRQCGKAEATLALLEQGLERWPGHQALRWGLALSLHHSNQPSRALPLLHSLALDDPNNLEIRLELGTCLAKSGQLQDAIRVLDQAAALNLQDPRALADRLRAHRVMLRLDQGELQEARQLLNPTEGEQPSPALLAAEALLLLAENNAVEAERRFRRLTALEPETAEHWLNLAACQKALKQMVAPLQTLEAARDLHPERKDLAQGLGSVLAENGRWQEALPLLLQAVAGGATKDVHHANLQFIAAGARLLPAEALQQHAQAWEQQRRLKPSPIWADHLRKRDPDRRLRVMYFSADFHNHPVGRFIEPILQNHDRTQVDLIGVSCGSIQDQQSQRLRQCCNHWLDVQHMTDLAGARAIAELEGDLLVELGGFTGGQRLRMLTARPAPIQVSYLGYFASTFLNCIDGWIGDHVLFPEGLEAEAGGQQLHRLERCYLTYRGESNLIRTRCGADPRFRFGCFNHSRKLSDPCLDLFAAVLRAVPNSLLVLKSQSFVEAAEQARIRQRLQARGIEEERLELLNWAADQQLHMELYGHMDVALDPIPYGGATTTAEALWMGVPVLALAGEGMVGRLSASLLAGAGLGAAIATSTNDYVARASALARRGIRSAEDRDQLHQHLKGSELLDAAGLSRALEQLYRRLWAQHLLINPL